MSDDRERALRAIREAARASADEGAALPQPVPVAPVQDLVAQFAGALQELRGELIQARTAAEAAARLLDLTAPQDRPWFVAERDLARQLAEHLPVARATREQLPDCQAAITEAEWLIADTATAALVLDARQPRGCYLLPEIHVVVATAHHILPTLADALLQMEQWARLPTACVFVTGPSRTADIEKTIVIPAHGPKRLVVVLLDEGTA
jgi:L-lactate dehydrogenase complex protein LldG